MMRNNSNIRLGIVHEIVAERLRQVDEEGWAPEHDDGHKDGEIAEASAAYALAGASGRNAVEAGKVWPWEDGFKPDYGRRDLVKAGALIIAEIERIDRLEAKEKGE